MDAEVPSPREPREPSKPEAFAVGYRAHTGDMMVFGGGVLTLVGVLATVVQGSPVFLLGSVAGSISALYFSPTTDLKTPQLGADQNGLYVARIGIIPWSEVSHIRVVRRALRTMRLATLYVETTRPLEEAVSVPDPLTPFMRISSRNARVKRGTIEVSLHTLALYPDDIEARLRQLYGASGKS